MTHYVLAQASLVMLTLGLWTYDGGLPQLEPLAAIGALGYGASFVIFAAASVVAMRASSCGRTTSVLDTIARAGT